MRFLVDAQLPPALARWLAVRGHRAEHVYDLAMGAAADRDVWALALQTSAVIVTKDEDFVLRAQVASPAPVIVWVRYGNVRTGELLRRMAAEWLPLTQALERGESVIELA